MAGVIFVGFFAAIFHFIDARLPIVAMGVARLIMEFISSKKHLALKREIRMRLKNRGGG